MAAPLPPTPSSFHAPGSERHVSDTQRVQGFTQFGKELSRQGSVGHALTCSETDTGVPVDLTNCASLRKAARRDGRRTVRCVLNCDSLSATDTEALDEVLVARLVLGLGVVEEFPALGDELQKATAGVVVFLVGLEVLGQRRDPRGQDRHLDIGRAGIAVLRREFLDDLRLFFSRYRHRGLLFWVMAQAGMSSSAAHGAKPGV